MYYPKILASVADNGMITGAIFLVIGLLCLFWGNVSARLERIEKEIEKKKGKP